MPFEKTNQRYLQWKYFCVRSLLLPFSNISLISWTFTADPEWNFKKRVLIRYAKPKTVEFISEGIQKCISFWKIVSVWRCLQPWLAVQQRIRKKRNCDIRNLQGESSALGFNQHKIAVTTCRNTAQRQERVIATTQRPAQHSAWNTKANCPELSRQQSSSRDK